MKKNIKKLWRKATNWLADITCQVAFKLPDPAGRWLLKLALTLWPRARTRRR